jgi:capsid protein
MNLWNFIKSIFAKTPDAATPYFSGARSYRPLGLNDARLDISKAAREVLQARSRDFELDVPLYSKIADVWEQYTVGTGIRFSSDSGEENWDAAADLIMDRWNGVADIQGRFSFDFLQGIISRKLFIDGEVFVLLTREGPYPRIQLIEAHRCKTPEELSSYEGKRIFDGVETDPNGRPTFYHFSNGKNDAGKETFTRQDAANVVHIFEPHRPDQYRGLPYCTAALNVLHDLYDLHILEMKAAKDAADISTVAYTQNGEMPQGLSSMASKFGGAQSATKTAPASTEQRREYYQSATGGRVVVAMSNDKIEQHIPERPGQNTREYWRLLAGQVCDVAGTPLALVNPDSMQGTVYRGAMDAAAAFFRCKTSVLAGYFRRIRNYVIQVESGYNRALQPMPANWRNISAGTVRAPNVDIGRNSSAAINELMNNARTYRDWFAENGQDWKKQFAQISAERKEMERLDIEPLDLLKVADPSAMAPQPQPETTA